ncbi:MAG TPA: hypothetical protein VGG64_04685 [Pirellulales bacterium]
MATNERPTSIGPAQCADRAQRTVGAALAADRRAEVLFRRAWFGLATVRFLKKNLSTDWSRGS